MLIDRDRKPDKILKGLKDEPMMEMPAEVKIKEITTVNSHTNSLHDLE